jgi:hypothetical protein
MYKINGSIFNPTDLSSKTQVPAYQYGAITIVEFVYSFLL